MIPIKAVCESYEHMMGVEEWKELICKTASTVFEEAQEVPPLISVLIKEEDTSKELIIDARPFFEMEDSDMGRKMLRLFVQDISKTIQPMAIAIISEAWMVDQIGSEAEIEKMPRPSEHPDKKEIVMIVFETPTSSEMRVFPINREEKKLDPEIPQYKMDQHLEGRLANNYIQKPVEIC